MSKSLSSVISSIKTFISGGRERSAMCVWDASALDFLDLLWNDAKAQPATASPGHIQSVWTEFNSKAL